MRFARRGSELYLCVRMCVSESMCVCVCLLRDRTMRMPARRERAALSSASINGKFGGRAGGRDWGKRDGVANLSVVDTPFLALDMCWSLGLGPHHVRIFSGLPYLLFASSFFLLLFFVAVVACCPHLGERTIYTQRHGSVRRYMGLNTFLKRGVSWSEQRAFGREIITIGACICVHVYVYMCVRVCFWL